MKPRILDLFCGAGGAAMGYHRAGFEVVGVDIEPQPHYPFEFVQGDAMTVLADLVSVETEFGAKSTFDAIHASPPCQSYLNLRRVNDAQGRPSRHDRLIGEVRRLLLWAGLPYVIENVADARAELLDPVRVCGTGMDLPLRRHRLFESKISLSGVACRHDRYTEPKYWTGWRPNGQHRLSTVVQVYGNAGGREHWATAMGIDWMAPAEMVEAIPPAYTEHIGRQLIRSIQENAA